MSRRSLNNLAELYEPRAATPRPSRSIKRALAIREKALGPEHPDVAISLNNLALLLLRHQGRYAEAEPLYKRALAIRRKRSVPIIPTSRSRSTIWLCSTTARSATPRPSRSTSARWRSTRKRSVPSIPTSRLSLNNLAELYRAQGRYAEAEPLYKRSLAIKEKALGPEHPDVAKVLNNLAFLYDNQGRYADAESVYRRALAISEKALGPEHPLVANSLNNLALLYRNQGRYADAEPLYKRSLAIFEKALGPDHPNVAASLNNLANLYKDQGRYAEALALVRRNIEKGFGNKVVAFQVLFQSARQNLIGTADAFGGSYETVQRVSSSAAGNAVSKLAARFAAGTDELAGLVRQDQDLTVEAEQLDKAILAAVSKPPAERNAATEDQVRKRIDAIKAERDKLLGVFNQRFPDYVALSKPQPVSLKETQVLLADDEALVVFDFDAKSYVWIITRTNADWIELKITATDLAAQIATLRKPMPVNEDKPLEPFDVVLAHKIYQATFGVVADKIAGKKRLSVVTNGALTSLPPQLLVTSDPTGKKLKDVDWLVRSYAITILPSVASLKVLRGGSATSTAA